MQDLIDWLRDRLDDDEETARVAAALTRSPWANIGSTVICADRFPVVSHGDGEQATAEHIALWDPARVLAEVAAKRRILDRHSKSDFPADSDELGGYKWQAHCDHCGHVCPCPDLLDIVQPFAERPGFREEWRS